MKTFTTTERELIEKKVAKRCCDPENEHLLRILPSVPCSNPNVLKFQRIGKSLQTWYFIAKEGNFDPKTHYLEKTCDVKRCIKHYRKRSRQTEVENFEEGDKEAAREYLLKNSTIAEDGGGCRLWNLSCCNPGGYGGGSFAGKNRLMHRFAYEVHKGHSLPSELMVRHIPNCKNTNCIEETHLQEGSAADNAKDRIEAGTALYGDRHPSTKYSDATIKKILETLGSKSPKEISNTMEIPLPYVTAIKREGKRRGAKVKPENRKHKRKLSPGRVRKIRSDYKRNPKESYNNLAKRYQTNATTVSKVIKRISFDDIKDNEEEQTRFNSHIEQENIEKAKERLEAQTKKEIVDCKQTEPCWTLIGPERRAESGYKSFFYCGKKLTAHVVSWMLHKNDGHPCEKGKMVLHKCARNRACVNPAHLELGDAKQNGEDMITQGSLYYGEQHHASVISDSFREELENEIDAGLKLIDIARKYSDRIAYHNVSNVAKSMRKRKAREETSEELAENVPASNQKETKKECRVQSAFLQ